MNEHVALRVPASGYDADFFDWTQDQARLLRAGKLDLIDIENIAEEIESLGKSDRRGIENQLVRLIAHLLKLRFSADLAPRGGWTESVMDARLQIELALDDSPSLRRRMPEFFKRNWPRGWRKGLAGLSPADRSGLGEHDVDPSFGLDEVLDPDFFPGD